MSDEINAQFGFERAFGKTNGNADADTKITKFGISFNSDGTTTFFAQLEKSSASQKEYLEKLQEKKAAEKKEAKKKEQSKQIEVRKTMVQANSKEELLDKIKNIDWDSIKLARGFLCAVTISVSCKVYIFCEKCVIVI